MACTHKRLLEICQILFAEVIGTAILLFGGCAGTLSWYGSIFETFTPSMTFGLSAMIAIMCFGQLPGGHPYINPAVTVAAVILRMSSIWMGFLCILAQVIGAVLGLQFLKFLTPDIIFQQSCGQFGMCQTYPHEGIDTFGTLLCEYVATMILIFICCAAWDPCNQSKQDSTPIKFGLAITVICIIFGPFTGCSMNPARSFAPSFLANEYTFQWMYWAAPILSALVTSLIYKLLFFGTNCSNGEKNGLQYRLN